MKKVKMPLAELIRQNKEDLLKDKDAIAKIEKRIDKKHVGSK
ncbi:FbpB family small basic protein [Cytobacillus sp. IB215665]|nr:FbpB family small basic protein [Cytobacillus sp. IB215665]MDX8366268.1 FbpB family small basic protein [Cytobacillus sp. IB215665]